MATPNASHPDPNYPDERGSAAPGSGLTVPGQTVCAMDQDGQPAAAQGPSQTAGSELAKAAPSKAAPATPSADVKRKKRGAGDALSPGHLASNSGTDRVERRPQHIITGVNRDFRDKVKEALIRL